MGGTHEGVDEPAPEDGGLAAVRNGGAPAPAALGASPRPGSGSRHLLSRASVAVAARLAVGAAAEPRKVLADRRDELVGGQAADVGPLGRAGGEDLGAEGDGLRAHGARPRQLGPPPPRRLWRRLWGVGRGLVLGLGLWLGLGLGLRHVPGPFPREGRKLHPARHCCGGPLPPHLLPRRVFAPQPGADCAGSARWRSPRGAPRAAAGGCTILFGELIPGLQALGSLGAALRA